jgi:pyranose oxidase
MLNSDQKPETNLSGAVVVYVAGGMAVHWTCAIPRHNEHIERIKFISAQEWHDLYGRAEDILNRHTNVFSDSIRHKVIKGYLRECNWKVEDTPLAAERRKDNPEFVEFTGADTVLKDLAKSTQQEKFTFLKQHRVTRLLHENGKVHQAEVREIMTGKDKLISAKIFIVAAGYLHTPQILWNSQIHTHEGSALGKYLTDHAFTGCTLILNKEIEDKIGAEASKTMQGTNDHEDPHPLAVPMKDPPPHLYIPISDERPWHSQIFRESFQYDPLPENVDDRRVIDLKWFGMIQPNRSNQVIFSSKNRDMLGMPQSTFHFELSEDDKRRLELQMADMIKLAQDLGGEYLPGPENEPQKYHPQVVAMGTSTHTMGATRMGDKNDGTSVVDPYSKVWDFDNLYVGGNCVIPTANASNPTLTSVALAIRASGPIIKNLKSLQVSKLMNTNSKS